LNIDFIQAKTTGVVISIVIFFRDSLIELNDNNAARHFCQIPQATSE
jgi:hypothetical protein